MEMTHGSKQLHHKEKPTSETSGMCPQGHSLKLPEAGFKLETSALGTELVLIPKKFLGHDSPVPIPCCPAQQKSCLLISRHKAHALSRCMERQGSWCLWARDAQRQEEDPQRQTETDRRETQGSVAEQSSFEADT